MPSKNRAPQVVQATYDEAGIVVVGNFNPSIFHAEWLIGKNIVGAWDYKDDENNICVPDVAVVNLPDGIVLTVQSTKLGLVSKLASSHITLSDIVIGIFSALKETPVKQLGMNLTRTYQFPSKDAWLHFGSDLAPTESWLRAADIDQNTEKAIEQAGLWDLTMHLPRPDDMQGWIRPRLSVHDLQNRELRFGVNNHVELEGRGIDGLIEVLKSDWVGSQKYAESIMVNIMDKHSS